MRAGKHEVCIQIARRAVRNSNVLTAPPEMLAQHFWGLLVNSSKKTHKQFFEHVGVQTATFLERGGEKSSCPIAKPSAFVRR